MNLFEKVKELNLPLGQYCVVGSGPLFAHNLRESNDIDLLITADLYKKLKENGWQIKHYQNGNEYLTFDCFEANINFCWKNYQPDPKYQIESAEIIKGIPFLRLDELLKWKREFRREKDLKDIVLIENYLKKV